MKAITLWQPWATLVAIGAKQRETRSWATQYRGPLAIHASAYGGANKRFHSPFYEALEEAGITTQDLPRGCIVATCWLVDCVQITIDNSPRWPELAFGDYAPGRWMWILEDIKRLPMPIPAKGKERLWEWDDSLAMNP